MLWSRLAGALVLVFAAQGVQSEIIPAARRIEWIPGVTVGVPGGIPKRTNVYTTLSPGATAAQINTAISRCPSNQVVKLAAGTFNLSAPINFGFAKGVTLRGAGMSTVLNATANIEEFVMIGGDTSMSSGTAITAGYTKGSSNLTVASVSGLAVGALVRIDQINEPGLAWARLGTAASRNITQVTRITALNGSVVTVWPPLYYASSGYSPRLYHFGGVSAQAELCGVEDVSMSVGGMAVPYGVMFDQTYGCWLKNVAMSFIANYNILTIRSLQTEIAKVYCNDSRDHEPNHGGVLIGSTSELYGSSGVLVYDSIFNRIFPGIQVNAGSSGNVIAYNLVKDSFYDGFGQGGGIFVNHSPHNMMTLVEGNIVNMIQNDGYFGSGSHHTYFRNWAHGFVTDGLGGSPGSFNSKCLSLNHYSLYENIVGNVLGNAQFTPTYLSVTLNDYSYSIPVIYQFGYPNPGNNDYSGTFSTGAQITGEDQRRDLRVESTAIIHGNWDSKSKAVGWAPEISDRQLPNSLYLPTKPAWFGNLPWPPVNPATGYTNLTFSSIPAGYRYVHGVDPPGVGDVVPPAPTNLRVVNP